MLNPMPTFEWLSIDPTNNLSSPHLQRLLTIWKGRCTGARLPSRQDIPAEDLMRLGGCVVLIDVEDPFRLRYRLIGAMITRTVGRDSTGRYLDELHDPDHYRRLKTHFDQVIANRAPLRMHGKLVYSNLPYLPVETIDMPLVDGTGRVSMILRGMDFDT